MDTHFQQLPPLAIRVSAFVYSMAINMVFYIKTIFLLILFLYYFF